MVILVVGDNDVEEEDDVSEMVRMIFVGGNGRG